MRIAVTGGTGFVGSHFIDAALAVGHEVTALTRRAKPGRDGLTWVAGDLADRAAMRHLVDNADAVVHVAGVLNVPTEADFDAANVAGTLQMLAAATAAGAKRFVFVSSLAAREPQLSMYGASKARAEELVRRSGLDWVIVRPPAVYGPGDKETLELFRMARRGFILMPPGGRASYLHVKDHARLLLGLAQPAGPKHIVTEPDDGRPAGWSHAELGSALAKAVGVPARTLSAPRSLLTWGARLDRLLRGEGAKLTADRVSYFCHPDWVADPAKAPPKGLWQPEIPTPEGLAETAAWYREKGWL